MKKPSDNTDSDYGVGDLLGLGSQSVRKNYYPALQERLEELEKERNRYKWLFENALHGIFRGNLRGGFIDVNPAMARICGYDSPQDLQQRVIRLREQLFCCAADFDAIRQELLDEGRVSVWETRLRRADATPVPVAITLLRRPDLGPEVVEAFVADITERVQARQKLEQLNADLERRVAERTEALQQANLGLRHQIREREKVEAELVVAVAAAEEANRSKDKYLAAASHDLMQPLNAARLLVSTLQDSRLPDKDSRMVLQIHRALEGAEDLLADLLDISKLDQQAITPDLVDVSAADLIYSVWEEFEPVADNAGLKFRAHPRDLPIRTDPRMLTRILRNLLSNAFRYTREGGVLIGARRRDRQLEISVWDTGVGIEQERLQEIFTEFHQLLPRQGSERQGVGLGLAIVERMVKILGYGISVVSQPGRGSCFTLSVPLASGPGQRLETARKPPVAMSPVAAGFAGIRVLVIDNEVSIRQSMTAFLESWGCEVDVAADAAGACALWPEGDAGPAVILADYHLDHGRDGCDAIAAVRQHLGREVPAAIITADRSDETLKLIRARQLSVLNKPVRPNRLRALLTSLIREVPQAR